MGRAVEASHHAAPGRVGDGVKGVGSLCRRVWNNSRYPWRGDGANDRDRIGQAGMVHLAGHPYVRDDLSRFLPGSMPTVAPVPTQGLMGGLAQRLGVKSLREKSS